MNYRFFIFIFFPIPVLAFGLIEMSQESRWYQERELRGWLADSFEESSKEFGIRGHLDFSFSSIHESSPRVFAIGSSQYPIRYHSVFRNSLGLEFPNGENIWANTSVTFRPASWLLAHASVQGGNMLPGERAQSWYHLSELFVQARFRSLSFGFGRKAMHWGQSYMSPLLISLNSTPLDAIHVEVLDHPLHGWMNWLGRTKSQIFISRMNQDRVPANDYQFGWRLGVKPWDKFEFNVGAIYETRGDGVAKGSISNLGLEILGTRRSYSEQADDSSNVTGRGVAFDIRVPLWTGLTSFDLYSEHHLRDCCGDFSSVINEYYSFLYGIEWRLSKDQFNVEWVQLGNKLYYHPTWPSNFSNDGFLLGPSAGRNGHQFYGSWRSVWNRRWQSLLFLFVENHQSDDNLDRGSSVLNFHPEYEMGERRFGTMARISFEWLQNIRLQGGAIVTRILNKESFSDRNTMEWAIHSGVKYEF